MGIVIAVVHVIGNPFGALGTCRAAAPAGASPDVPRESAKGPGALARSLQAQG